MYHFSLMNDFLILFPNNCITQLIYPIIINNLVLSAVDMQGSELLSPINEDGWIDKTEQNTKSVMQLVLPTFPTTLPLPPSPLSLPLVLIRYRY